MDLHKDFLVKKKLKFRRNGIMSVKYAEEINRLYFKEKKRKVVIISRRSPEKMLDESLSLLDEVLPYASTVTVVGSCQASHKFNNIVVEWQPVILKKKVN